MLPTLSLVMEFLGNVFTNFTFEKFLSHEALVTEFQLPVTVKRSFFSSYEWQKLSSNIGSFDSFRNKLLAEKNWGGQTGAKAHPGPPLESPLFPENGMRPDCRRPWLYTIFCSTQFLIRSCCVCASHDLQEYLTVCSNLSHQRASSHKT